jgi:diguanylate cyclase (GGDEF)-like protein
VRRIWPFALVAVLAEASSAMPPGPKSLRALWVSLGFLAACAFTIAGPWVQRRRWMRVVPAILFCTSVVWLQLAQGGSATGIMIVFLIPLIWAVLYQGRLESAVVVAAVVAGNLCAAAITHASTSVMVRRGVLWTLISALIAVSVHVVRDRMANSAAQQAELRRQAVALRAAAERLTAIHDVDGVIATSVALAAELASPPGNELRRATFFRPVDGRITAQSEFDQRNWSMGSFPIEDDPYLPEVLTKLVARHGVLREEDAGPELREILRDSGVKAAGYVPVLYKGRLEGVLSVSSRSGPLTDNLFEQLKGVGRLTELALSNARANEEREAQATTDELTGLQNRRGFDRLLVDRPGRSGFAILCIDVDDLKSVNDALGHRAGDELLVMVASTLNGLLRRGDVMARVGGDEFAVICFGASSATARKIADRMIQALTEMEITGWPIRVSIGVAAGGSCDEARAVLERADAVMYEAKRQGGMQFVVAPESFSGERVSSLA